MSEDPLDEFQQWMDKRHRNPLTRMVDKLTGWWWDRKHVLYQRKHADPKFRAGMRKVEDHILDDIEFGYDADMVASKIRHRNYSYEEPASDPLALPTGELAVLRESIGHTQKKLAALDLPTGDDLEVSAKTGYDTPTPTTQYDRFKALLDEMEVEYLEGVIDGCNRNDSDYYVIALPEIGTRHHQVFFFCKTDNPYVGSGKAVKELVTTDYHTFPTNWLGLDDPNSPRPHFTVTNAR